MRLLILLLASVVGLVEVRADTYPKNLRVDVINYRFALELQDQNDRISGTADVDLRFVGFSDNWPDKARNWLPTVDTTASWSPRTA